MEKGKRGPQNGQMLIFTRLDARKMGSGEKIKKRKAHRRSPAPVPLNVLQLPDPTEREHAPPPRKLVHWLQEWREKKKSVRTRFHKRKIGDQQPRIKDEK